MYNYEGYERDYDNWVLEMKYATWLANEAERLPEDHYRDLDENRPEDGFFAEEEPEVIDALRGRV